MRRFRSWILVGCLAFFSHCDPSDDVGAVFSLSYEFSDSDEGWTGDFADYPEGDSLNYELKFKHDTLPTNLNAGGTLKALLISGHNHSDDLFMFIKRKVSGLDPNTTYEVLFNVRFASEAPTGAVGIGGAPGESVIVKAGATLVEPKKELQLDGMYRMNIDKGNQGQEGVDMINIGNVGVGPSTEQFTYVYRNNNSSSPFLFTTDEGGELWFIIGTDSGFEGVTTLYYVSVDILFNEVSS